MKREKKNNKYFLNLEHNNKQRSTIRKLICNGESITQPSIIMKNIKNFFKEKYVRKSNFSPKHCEDFLKDMPTAQLTAEEALECEGPIIKQNINKCLQDMGYGKSPGDDGLPKEFYLFF